MDEKLTEKAVEGFGAAEGDHFAADFGDGIKEVLRVAIEATQEIIQDRIDAMRQRVEMEKRKEVSTSLDYYQGRVNEGEVIKAHILRLLTAPETAESLFKGALDEKR